MKEAHELVWKMKKFGITVYRWMGSNPDATIIFPDTIFSCYKSGLTAVGDRGG
jgi:hypothetical protein